MAAIQGVIVTGVIVPSDTLDTYAVIDPTYGIDGLRNLTGGTNDLNLITTDRRRAGMLVGISNGASYYKLNVSPWANNISDWTLVSFGGTFTGGTVTGPTTFTNGLTANTFSATTYLNLPKDIRLTGGTYSASAGTVVFTNNTGGTFNVSGFSTSTGGTFTGGTISGATTFTNGLTANTFSATTYLNLPINLQKIITANYTATSADNNYTILINNNGTPVTITTPSGLLSKISIGFIQQGTANVTISGGTGVTINSPAGMLKIKGQNYWAYLEQVSNSNVYQLVGSLKT